MRLISIATRLALMLGLVGLFAGCAAFRSAPELQFADADEVGMSAEQLREIRPKLQSFIDAGKLPGFATLVARDGKIVHLDAFGYRDIEAGLPMNIDTIFRMYSMTKPVTGVAVMQQVDRGRIALNDPVSRFIPGFAEMEVISRKEDGTVALVPSEVTMTIEHLLTHTSGLSYGVLNREAYAFYEELGLNDFTNQSLEAFARAAATVPLLHEPGTAWNYSIGMDVLGRIVEIASGLPYDVYLQKNLFGPLGMVDSGFYVPEEKRDRFAEVYTPTEDGEGMVPMKDTRLASFLSPPAMASGGGGMVGTISDYYRFAQMLLNGGELDGVRVLSEQSAWEITRDHLGPGLGKAPLSSLASLSLVSPDEDEPTEPRQSSLLAMGLRGLGFGYCGSVVREDAMSIFGSPGSYWWGGLASTDFWIDPQENLVAILCTQLIPAGTYPTRVVFSTGVYKAIKESHAETVATK